MSYIDNKINGFTKIFFSIRRFSLRMQSQAYLFGLKVHKRCRHECIFRFCQKPCLL